LGGSKTIRQLTTYTAYKCGRFILGFLVVCALQFAIPRLMPGSPVFAILGPDVIGMSQKDYATLEKELGLNDPITVQFARQLLNTLKGNFGFSYHLHQPVKQVIQGHMKPSLLVLLPSVVLSSILACLLGVLAGHLSGQKLDLLFTPFFVFMSIIPAFLLAMMFLDIFSFRLNLLPLGGLRSMVMHEGWLLSCLDTIHHLFLPVTVLTLTSTAGKYLVMRNSVVESRGLDFVRYARARGLGEGRILFVHILRYASLPLVSLVGLQFAFILSGSLLVEIVFSINGMGSLIHEAALNRDYPVLHASFMLLTVVVLAVNMFTDFLYGILDPRVRT
jgi:peptide/nickel transport system permease protein